MADNRKVIIVGGGLVGALNACYLAKRGYQVELYELREDIRKQEKIKGRSINLTLALKGRTALEGVGLKDLITNNGIPIYARMVHNKGCDNKEIFYGKNDESILSLDRRRVNELLLSAAEEYPNVQLFFNHKLQCCNYNDGVATFKHGDEEIRRQADLIVGCDGAYSTSRAQMMKCTKIDFSQSYLNHGYMELRIPPRDKSHFTETSTHLHIWPREKFLMLSFPDFVEKCFVTTLMMPFEMFGKLKTEKELLDFFEEHFPDFIKFIGVEKEDLVETFFSRDPLPLVSVKCKPYHIHDKGVFMGDAAHAMVPFYGQGMNCGFQDCLVFNEILEKYNDDLSKALPEFSRVRNPDVEAMVDLSMRQYTVLMSTVNKKSYIMRKHLDNFLHWMMPNTWVPIYTSVAFSLMPYSECIKNRKWQNGVLRKAASVAGAALAVGGAVATYKLAQNDSFLNGTLGTEVWQKITDFF